jgi:protein-S-isoprenylcysteine O-methyltransferase Ste14
VTVGARALVRRGGVRAALAAAALHAAVLAAARLAPGAAPGRLADPAVWAFAALWVAWSGLEAGLARPAPEPRPPGRDRALAALTGSALLASAWFGLRLHPQLALSAPWRVAAAVGLAAGVALRVGAIWQLGDRFVTAAAAGARAPLFTEGVYRIVRHPSEAGLVLAAAGGAVLLRSAVALALSAAVVLPLTVLRALAEDRALAQAHGALHEAYRRRAGMLLPRAPRR